MTYETVLKKLKEAAGQGATTMAFMRYDIAAHMSTLSAHGYHEVKVGGLPDCVVLIASKPANRRLRLKDGTELEIHPKARAIMDKCEDWDDYDVCIPSPTYKVALMRESSCGRPTPAMVIAVFVRDGEVCGVFGYDNDSGEGLEAEAFTCDATSTLTSSPA